MMEGQIAADSIEESSGANNQSIHHYWFRLGRAAAWIAILSLLGTWLAGAWFYVRGIYTDLDFIFRLSYTGGWSPAAIRAAAAGLGVTPSLYPWTWLVMEVMLVASFALFGVILLRHKQDWFGVYLGVTMVLIGTRIAGPVSFALFAALPILEAPFRFLSGLAFGAFGMLLYLFPDGQVVPRWLRWGLPLIVVLQFGGYIGLSASWVAVLSMGYLAIGVASQIYRYRRVSDDVTRRHIRWVAASFVCFILVVVTAALIAPNVITNTAPPTPWDLLVNILVGPILTIASILFVVALSVAVLRDGLYHLNIFINRTLVYGGLTAVVAALYALTVGSFSLFFQSQNSLLLSLLATGLIGVLFQPLRARLQGGVNRLMFGDRDDPYVVLSRLGRQLRETAVPGETLPALTTTIQQALKLPYVAVELATADGGRQTAAISGRPSTVAEEWPLLYQGEQVGWLLVAPRSPQERFTNRERQLLADIAGQAGVAAYAARLTTALQRSRERLVLAREEERRRIRRDLHDELGPSLASQTFKLDAALELLETNPAAAADLLQSLKGQNQALIADIRRLVYALRPPSLDELGLLAALQIHVAPLVQRNSSLFVAISAMPDPLPSLPAAVEVAAYRIVMEAITNVMRHARAQRCDIYLTLTGNSLTLVVSDDGVGLQADMHPGVGLASMRERTEELGGSLDVGSAAVNGMQVTAVLPLVIGARQPWQELLVNRK